MIVLGRTLVPVLMLVLVAGCTDRSASRRGSDQHADDIALQAGVQDRFSRLRGIAPADYDLDGDIDLFFANTGDPSRFYWNTGVDSRGDAVFEPGPVLLESERAYFAAPADYDNDGDADLFVGVGAVDTVGFDRLYQNANGVFVDITETAGIAGPFDDSGQATPTATGGGAWGDYDNDGWLDLYVTTQRNSDSAQLLLGRNTLYRNRGNGTFEDVTDDARVGDTRSGWSASWLDYDNDGFLDLYVPNRDGPNVLYHNEGNGTFTDVTTPELEQPEISWGSLTDDFDNDGWMDLLVVGRTFGQEDRQASRLFINDGTGRFVDLSFEAGLVDENDPSTFGTWMGFQAGDFTNDGFSEIVLGAGTPGSGSENHLFLNKSSAGAVQFEIISDWINYPAPDDGEGFLLWKRFPEYPYRTHGMTFADFDEDGDLDLLIGNGGSGGSDETREPNRLYRNDSGSQTNWIRLQLMGSSSNRDGIGSRIVVRSRDGSGRINVRHKMVKGISGFGGNNPIDPHIGIGEDKELLDVTIWWPSGVLQSIENPAMNTEIDVQEPTAGSAGTILDLLSLVPGGDSSDEPGARDSGSAPQSEE